MNVRVLRPATRRGVLAPRRKSHRPGNRRWHAILLWSAAANAARAVMRSSGTVWLVAARTIDQGSMGVTGLSEFRTRCPPAATIVAKRFMEPARSWPNRVAYMPSGTPHSASNIGCILTHAPRLMTVAIVGIGQHFGMLESVAARSQHLFADNVGGSTEASGYCRAGGVADDVETGLESCPGGLDQVVGDVVLRQIQGHRVCRLHRSTADLKPPSASRANHRQKGLRRRHWHRVLGLVQYRPRMRVGPSNPRPWGQLCRPLAQEASADPLRPRSWGPPISWRATTPLDAAKDSVASCASRRSRVDICSNASSRMRWCALCETAPAEEKPADPIDTPASIDKRGGHQRGVDIDARHIHVLAWCGLVDLAPAR